MLPIILMIIGAVMFLLGMFLLFSIFMEPFRKAYNVFWVRNDDYVEYETNRGKKLLEHEVSVIRSTAIVLIIIGIILFFAGWFMKNASRGNDSLFSENVENGALEGDAETYSVQNIINTDNGSNKYIAEDGKEYSVFITVTGDKYFINNKEIEGEENLKNFVSKMDRSKEVYLIDDFASSYSFHYIEELLEENGIKTVKGQ